MFIGIHAERRQHALGYLWEYGWGLFWEFLYSWWIF